MARKVRNRVSGYTILVVDDQEEALTSTRRLLEREGHTVLTAASGKEALARLQETPVTLILLDYFMPCMNGDELVRQIRAFDQYVQIVLLTGYSGEKPARAMLAELDIQGYHDKADGPDKLLLWVDVALKAHRTVKALRERERVKTELIANVSHEFRTPLNVIGGYASLLLDSEFGALPDAAQQPLRALSNATHDLTELVVEFLDYAKLEARAVDVVRQWISTRDLVSELGRMAGLLLEGRPIEFRTEVDEAPAAVLTDSVKLRTILRNLITNAAKFTAVGAITLRVRQTSAAVCFAVQDTGPGISADDTARVFEPFRQLESSRGRGGFGLGLALSRKLARVLGGSLGLVSEVGVGSTFELTLPLSVVSEPARPSSGTGAAAAAAAPWEAGTSLNP